MHYVQWSRHFYYSVYYFTYTGTQEENKTTTFYDSFIRGLVNMKTVCAYVPSEQTKKKTKNKYNRYITVCTMIHKVKLWIVFLALENNWKGLKFAQKMLWRSFSYFISLMIWTDVGHCPRKKNIYGGELIAHMRQHIICGKNGITKTCNWIQD